MQSYVLSEEYTKKLNEIIEFFKTEKEIGTFYFAIGKEDSRFNYTIILSIFVILIAVLTTLSNIDKGFNNDIIIFLGIIMLFLALYMFIDLRSSKKMNTDFIHESIKFNVIIANLQSLKILPYEVNLSKLIDKLKYRYHLKPTLFPINEYITEIWFEEIEYCLSEINKEVLEKENTISLSK